MSSSKIRIAIGSATAHLRRRIDQAKVVLENIEAANEQADQTVERTSADTKLLEENLVQIRSSLDRLESARDQWALLMDSLDGAKLVAEEKRFEECLKDDRHFCDWMEDGREIALTIALLLADDQDSDGDSDTEGGHGNGRAALVRKAMFPKPPPIPIAPVVVRDLPADHVPIVAQYPPDADVIAPQIKLPMLKLPSFSGDPLEWPGFWQAFSSAIHSKPLAPVDKLTYLVGCISGRASKVIIGYRGGENYQNAVDALDNAFGKENIIVETLQAELINLSPARDSVDSLRFFLETLERVGRHMEALKHPDDNPLLRQMIKNKLPQSVLAELVKAERADKKKWGMAEIRKALADIVSLREEVVRCSRPFRREESHPQPQYRQQGNARRQSEHTRVFAITSSGEQQSSQTRSPPQCIFCELRHWAADCTKVKSAEARIRILNQQQRCHRCLRKHATRDCHSPRKCQNCQGQHNKAICPKFCETKTGNNGKYLGKDANKEPIGQRNQYKHAGVNALAQISQEEESVPYETQTIMSIAQSPKLVDIDNKAGTTPGRVMLMATKVWVGHATKCSEIKALVFFDIGSQVTLIKRSLVDKLKLGKVADDKLEVMPFQARRPLRLNAPQFALRLKGPDCEVPIVAHRADWIVPSVCRAENYNGSIVSINEEPDILIGISDFWGLVQGVEEFSPEQPGIFRVLTSLGPILCGKEAFPSEMRQKQLCSVLTLPGKMMGADPEIDQMKRFWDLQTIGITDDPKVNDDDVAVKLFDDSFQRHNNGRYIAGWPWKEFPPKLPSNFQMAFRRLVCLLNKLEKTPEIFVKYDETIRKQLELGYIEPAGRSWGTEHFLPHHHIVTKKLRVVFDASAHSRGESSLNDCILRGPVMIPDLVGILMRFRLGTFALWSDLESAFLQISLPDRDKEVCKFLWIVDPTKPPKGDNLQMYRWARVPFGVIASPFLLARVVLKHLETYNTPLAKEYTRNAYVDNLLTLCESEEEAMEKYSEGKQIFAEAKMNLREFICNSETVMSKIPIEDRLDKTNPKVLGIPWNPQKDELTIAFPSSIYIEKVTKRIVLKELASIFDPLGFCCPCLLEAKLFLQKLWDRPLAWDEPLLEKETTQWRCITNRWETEPIIIPRRGISSLSHSFQLHAFVDASKDAYAAVLFLRSEANGLASSRMFFGKSRLKPRKIEVTIPRMELLAMLIGARAINFAEKELNLPISGKFLWGDSKSVLGWVASKATQPRFVQNRLKEIRLLGHDVRFKYVPTEQNPADVASRGCSPDELRCHPLWWRGPEWLTQDESHWPGELEVNPPADDLDIENNMEDAEKSILVISKIDTDIAKNIWIDPTRFSKWERLVRTVVTVRNFLKKDKSPLYKKSHGKIRQARPISAEEYVKGEKCLLRMSQEVWPLVSQAQNNWKIVTDECGLLRVETRLHYAINNRDFKNPILLSFESPITKLLIQKAHEDSHHAGVEVTLTAFLTQYWIPRAWATAKKVVRSCLRCRKIQGPAFALPLMPPLPTDRVVRSSPFSSVGIDYLGPTQARRQDGTIIKAWIVLITCLNVRAVYLEPVPDLSAASFLQILRRFCSRRGTPNRIISDNGTQFVLAAKAAAGVEAGRKPSSALDNFLAREGIHWRFIPQISPWQGGVYERLVALVKAAFKRVLGRRILDWDELTTFITEVEASINQRPLTHVDESAEGCLPLRPIDFISPRSTLSIDTNLLNIDDSDEDYEQDVPNLRDKLIKSWQATNQLLDSFWKRWQTEYLLMLRQRLQWKHKGPRSNIFRDPIIGEVVLIEEDKQPRNIWPMGRVEELLGKPGAVRNAKLKISSGKIISRPVSRLFPLEANPEIGALDNQLGNKMPTKAEAVKIDENKKDENKSNNQGMMTRARAKLMGTVLLIFLIFAFCLSFASAEDINEGARAVSLTASSESCSRSEHGTVCRIESATEVTLLPAGQPVRLVLRGPNEIILGVLEITLNSLTTNCLARSERWLRSYKMEVFSAKSCPGEGSCINDFCSKIAAAPRWAPFIDELGESSQSHPGITNCYESCSFWWCGCARAGASCLFFRQYAIPASSKIYELISCPRTEHRISTKLILEIGGNITEETIISLIPGITVRWGNISLTVIGISPAPAPILSRKFLFDGIAAAVVENVQTDLLCPDQSAAENLNCTVGDNACKNCAPDHDSERVYCTCRNSLLEEIIEDPQNRLPLDVEPLNVKNKGREIFTESSYAPIQLLIRFDGLRLATEEDLTKCDIDVGPLHGCYRCHTGGTFFSSCRTNFGSALADIQCDDGSAFTQQCRPEAEFKNVTLSFPQAEINTVCRVKCKVCCKSIGSPYTFSSSMGSHGRIVLKLLSDVYPTK